MTWQEQGTGAPNCIAALGPCPPPNQLEPLWRDLEGRAEPSVFLSWVWIGTVIEQFGVPKFLARITRDGELVALALLNWRAGRWYDWLRRPSLHLNETGDPGADRVMIEYNGVLAVRGYEDAAASALVVAQSRADAPLWREWHLGGVPDIWGQLCREHGLAVRLTRWPQKAPIARFASMGSGDLLDQLSRNSRQQVRRSIRHYERRGPLTLTRASSCEEATDGLAKLAELHTTAWQNRGQPGAFADPAFTAFHRALIRRGFGEAVPDLLCIRAGAGVIGYLYNFRWRGWAYAYQSGLLYEQEAESRPGLMCHLLAMRHYRDEGLIGYRFLAGDSRYKTSLSTETDSLLWLVAARPDWSHNLEIRARALMTSLKSWLPASPTHRSNPQQPG